MTKKLNKKEINLLIICIEDEIDNMKDNNTHKSGDLTFYTKEELKILYSKLIGLYKKEIK